MARIADIPKVLRTVGPWGLLKRIWAEIGEDNIFTLGAALAYSWMFAIFPFFIFLLTLVPYLPDRFRIDAREQVANVLPQIFANEGAKAVMDNLDKVLNTPRGGLLSLGIILTIWAASGGMAATMSALDQCYEVPKPRPIYKSRPLAALLTILVATMLITVMVLIPVGNGISAWLRDNNRYNLAAPLLWAIDFSRYALSILLLFVALSLIYHWGPNIRQKYRLITPGAVFVVAVWLLLSFTFRVYVNKFGKYDQTYGTLGGAAVLLTLFYIDAVVLLIGAEINSEIDFATGRVRPGAEGSKIIETPQDELKPGESANPEAPTTPLPEHPTPEDSLPSAAR